jgi:hypothetical protein
MGKGDLRCHLPHLELAHRRDPRDEPICHASGLHHGGIAPDRLDLRFHHQKEPRCYLSNSGSLRS